MKYKIYNYLAGFFSLAIITTSCVNDEDLIQVDPNNNAVDSFGKLTQMLYKVSMQSTEVYLLTVLTCVVRLCY